MLSNWRTTKTHDEKRVIAKTAISDVSTFGLRFQNAPFSKFRLCVDGGHNSEEKNVFSKENALCCQSINFSLNFRSTNKKRIVINHILYFL